MLLRLTPDRKDGSHADHAQRRFSAPKTPSKPPMAAADMDKQMAQMQEILKRMEQLMDRIRQTQAPKAPHELMDEHAKAVQEHLQMMIEQSMRHQLLMQAAPAK